jgi:2-oxo-4-hydroxy-4-carboxy--5-ureidoimidazoline (OHCU) decarboxylase
VLAWADLFKICSAVVFCLMRRAWLCEPTFLATISCNCLSGASHDVQVKLEAAHPSMANMIQAAVAEAATAILDEAGASSRDYTVARERISSLHSAG